MAKAALGRRRGTRGRSKSQNGMIVGLVVALVSTALLLGIVLGANVLMSPSQEAHLAQKEATVSVGNLMSNMRQRGNLLRKRAKPGNQAASTFTDRDEKPREVDRFDNALGRQDDDSENDRPGANGMTPDEEPTPDKPFPYLGPVVEAEQTFSTWTAPGGYRFEEYKTGGTPYLIPDSMRMEIDEVARSRRVHVKNAMKHAWGGYDLYAFGNDEVLPQSKGTSNNWGGMGTTLVDSLDTLWLMGLKDEFWKARDWVRDSLSHDHVGSVSVFETTIRSLGGLLSAYDWSGDVAFLEKAEDLGKRLFKAFDSPSGLPWGQVNLQNGRTSNIGWSGGNVILAEFGTLQLEFRYLARATGTTDYATTSERVFPILNEISPENGLFPYFIRNKGKKPEFANSKLTFGAMSDSIYEYMLKIWLQGGKTEPLYRNMYDKAIQGMHDELLMTSTPSGLTYIADKNMQGGAIDHKMDHLVCFMGGLLALGAYTDPLGLDSPRAQRDLETGKALTYTCYQMYARMNTGISAEYVQFYDGKDFEIGRGAPHYLLRPEAVESFFILNQLTGDPIYREWGWEVFQAIERYCKTEIAYGSLHDVRKTNDSPENKMESFFLAETLKYLYLLQDPDTEVDVLNKHVFNTEAHPMRTFPSIEQTEA